MLKNQIFISYRRCDGKTVAKFLYDYLTHMNYLVFRDEESAHNGRFDEAIYNAIDECKDFILIVSPKVAYFDNDEMDIRIMYGRVWPKSIEIINKVSVGIEDILFEQQKEQQTIILEGKNGDNYKVEILDQINYKNTNYYVVITCEKYENIDIC